MLQRVPFAEVEAVRLLRWNPEGLLAAAGLGVVVIAVGLFFILRAGAAWWVLLFVLLPCVAAFVAARERRIVVQAAGQAVQWMSVPGSKALARRHDELKGAFLEACRSVGVPVES